MLKKLNIAMTYPVNWSNYAVMRDYIQNFFDATGPSQFQDAFRYQYENQVLVMFAKKGFVKEWLYYMGASTKRDSKGNYAGKFGEGFKIASLIAYRDLKLKITMESRDWRLQVTEIEEAIDGKNIKFLAYDVSKRRYEENAVLTLDGVSEELFRVFLRAVKQFCYKGNPRFGEMIACGKDFAVYHAGESRNKDECCGYLYAAYQERKSFELPIIICHHTYTPHLDDRDREEFSAGETVWCIREVFEKTKPMEALNILQVLHMCWSGRKLKGVSFSPGRLIPTLINHVQRCKKAKRQFYDMYHDKIVADFEGGISPNRRKIATVWYRKSGYHGKRQIVIHEFVILGILDLEELCEQNNGFQVCANPNQEEQRYIAILEETAKGIFGDIISYEKLPKCEIVLNPEAAIEGYAITTKTDRAYTNQIGLRIERKISNVYLKKYLFDKNNFSEALSVYMHELLHQYGGDSSLQFHKALLLMNRKILENSEKIDEFEKRWRKVV